MDGEKVTFLLQCIIYHDDGNYRPELSCRKYLFDYTSLSKKVGVDEKTPTLNAKYLQVPCVVAEDFIFVCCKIMKLVAIVSIYHAL